MFKFKGKRNLLKILQQQLENPNISLKDIQYSREEIYSMKKDERVTYIDGNIHHTIVNTYSKFTQKTEFFYVKYIRSEKCDFIKEEIVTLSESEEKQNESYIS